MSPAGESAVTLITITDEEAGQRIDNYLVKRLKGVPKSHLYRVLRKGEVRINKKRIEATYRLQSGDQLRIPPIQTARRKTSETAPVQARLAGCTLYEDDALLVINKPSGMAVHGGSGISRGVVEQLRLERPDLRYLELAHRLDRETSGVLMLAKKRSALVRLHQAMRDGAMDKRYFALIKGSWKEERRHVKQPLLRYLTAEGERRVSVHPEGMPSHTIFNRTRGWTSFTLLEAELKTGRTHQIRVHLAHLGFPIAGDDKYGDFTLNKSLQQRGLKRMFLHAHSVVIQHPLTDEVLTLAAPLPEDLLNFLKLLDTDAQTI